MEAHRSLERTYLGLYLQPVSQTLAQGLRLAGDSGLLVDDVEQHSPASEAGFEPGDVILSANGRDISDLEAFQNVLNSLQVDQSLLFEIERKRMRVSLNVKPIFEPAHDLEQISLPSPGGGFDSHRPHDKPDSNTYTSSTHNSSTYTDDPGHTRLC